MHLYIISFLLCKSDRQHTGSYAISRDLWPQVGVSLKKILAPKLNYIWYYKLMQLIHHLNTQFSTMHQYIFTLIMIAGWCKTMWPYLVLPRYIIMRSVPGVLWWSCCPRLRECSDGISHLWGQPVAKTVSFIYKRVCERISQNSTKHCSIRSQKQSFNFTIYLQNFGKNLQHTSWELHYLKPYIFQAFNRPLAS